MPVAGMLARSCLALYSPQESNTQDNLKSPSLCDSAWCHFCPWLFQDHVYLGLATALAKEQLWGGPWMQQQMMSHVGTQPGTWAAHI